MNIQVVKDKIFRYGCNFCDRKQSESAIVYGFIRDKGNSVYVRMCDRCLHELHDFRIKYLETLH